MTRLDRFKLIAVVAIFGLGFLAFLIIPRMRPQEGAEASEWEFLQRAAQEYKASWRGFEVYIEQDLDAAGLAWEQAAKLETPEKRAAAKQDVNEMLPVVSMISELIDHVQQVERLTLLLMNRDPDELSTEGRDASVLRKRALRMADQALVAYKMTARTAPATREEALHQLGRQQAYCRDVQAALKKALAAAEASP